MNKKKLLFIVVGLGGVAYLIMRRRQENNVLSAPDFVDYGFGDAVNENLNNPDEGCPAGVVQGCNVEGATNYDPCVNWPAPSTCTFPAGEVYGCMNPNASNYNPDATIHAASQCAAMSAGCKDPAACNYNPDAQFQQAGTCIYPAATGGAYNNCDFNGITGYSGQLTNYSPCITCEDYLDPSYMGPL